MTNPASEAVRVREEILALPGSMCPGDSRWKVNRESAATLAYQAVREIEKSCQEAIDVVVRGIEQREQQLKDAEATVAKVEAERDFLRTIQTQSDNVAPWKARVATLAATIAAKDGEIAELRRDAARYRLLRDVRGEKLKHIDKDGSHRHIYVASAEFYDEREIWGDELDAAIDAAKDE